MSYEAEVLADSPAAYWTWADGALIDRSGHGHTLAPLGSPVVSGDGPVAASPAAVAVSNDAGYEADAIGDLPTAGDRRFTVEAWVKGAPFSDQVLLYQDGYYFNRSWHVTGQAGHARANSNETASPWPESTGIAFDGTWHHVVVTFDAAADRTEFYIDGVLDSVDTTPFAGGGGSYTTRIGHGFAGGTCPTVELAHVALYYNAVLPAGRVAAHFAAAGAAPEEPPEDAPNGAENPVLWGAVRLHVWMALADGAPLTLDDATLGRLDRGNVLDGTGAPGAKGRLWEEVTCDVLDVSTHLGGTAADGVIARAEASTATIVLADPARRYDPMAPAWPRLAPGMEVLVWAEHSYDQAPDFLAQNAVLFLGRAETITEPWSPHPNQRRCTVVATDVVPDLVANLRAELAWPIAAGELARDRVARILDAFGPAPALNDTVVRTLSGATYTTVPADPSVVHLQATTLPDSAWAELNKVADAEVGFLYVEPIAPDPYSTDWVQKVQFLPRSTWQNETTDPLVLPCGVTIGARVTASDGQQRTRVTGRRAPLADEGDRLAARDEVIGFVAGGGALNSDFTFPGATGTYLTYRAGFAAAFYAGHTWPVGPATLLAFLRGLLPQVERTRSFPANRPLGYTRTDLELAEAEVPGWVAYVLASFQRPRAAVDAVTLRPGAAPGLWPAVLGLHLAVDRVQLNWQPPDGGAAIAVTGRVIGVEHTITRSSWTVGWNLADVELAISGYLLAVAPDTELVTESGDFIRLS